MTRRGMRDWNPARFRRMLRLSYQRDTPKE